MSVRCDLKARINFLVGTRSGIPKMSGGNQPERVGDHFFSRHSAGEEVRGPFFARQ